MLIRVSDKLQDFGLENPIIFYDLSANEKYPLLKIAFGIISELFSFKNFFMVPAKIVTESESDRYAIEFESEEI
jgi:hypothetical protein